MCRTMLDAVAMCKFSVAERKYTYDGSWRDVITILIGRCHYPIAPSSSPLGPGNRVNGRLTSGDFRSLNERGTLSYSAPHSKHLPAKYSLLKTVLEYSCCTSLPGNRGANIMASSDDVVYATHGGASSASEPIATISTTHIALPLISSCTEVAVRLLTIL